MWPAERVVERVAVFTRHSERVIVLDVSRALTAALAQGIPKYADPIRRGET